MNVVRNIVAVAAAALSCFAAVADTGTLRFGASNANAPSVLEVRIGAGTVPVNVPPMAAATAVRDAALAALQGAGYTVTDNGPGGDELTVQNLSTSDALTLATGNSAQVEARATGTGRTTGHIANLAHFDPFDSLGQPAIFTAGIVTDVGELSVQVSSQELNFQTDGPIICQALFQRLAPRAPQYGAQINYAGDRLEVYFDPAYTVTQGGIIFGTTSPTQGCEGRLHAPELHRSVEMRFGIPTTPLIETELIELSLTSVDPIMVDVLPGWTPDQLADAWITALRTDGYAAFDMPADGMITIRGLTDQHHIAVEPGRTGQDSTEMSGRAAHTGEIHFVGTFDPLDAVGQPAFFTAGIVTDVGVLTERISSQELSFQTDGPIICQALFQRLAPRAPQYGAQINFAGDRLEVYFDPAYTVTQGGIIFGTNSLSPGCRGDLGFEPVCPDAPAVSGTSEPAPGQGKVEWSTAPADATHMDVFRERRQGGSWTSPVLVATVPAAALMHIDTPPSQGVYRYALMAHNPTCYSGASAALGVKPAKPTGLSTSNESGAARLNWLDRSRFETAHLVQRQQRISGQWVNTTTVANLAKNITTHLDSPGPGQWRYRVRSSNLVGTEGYTAWRTVTLP